MNLLTNMLHLLGSGAIAYYSAQTLRDPKTRPNMLAGFQLAESGSVPFLTALKERAAAQGDAWLAERLARHAADEQRHGHIFAHALHQIGKRVIDFKSVADRTLDGQPQERQRSPFFAAYFEGYTSDDLKPEKIDWITFMGSTYILELDASKDFRRMAKVLPEEETSSRHLKRGLLSIAVDETRHAAYLRQALDRRLSPLAAQAVVDHWRDRKVNAMMTMVSHWLQKGTGLPTLTQESAPTDTLPEAPELAAA